MNRRMVISGAAVLTVGVWAVLADPPAAGNASERLRVIVAPTSNEVFSARMKAVHALGRKMTAEECQAVGDYLRTPSRADAPDRKMENWLRNDIMDKLVTQNTPLAGVAQLLVDIYEDREQDVVMRDYAVQHIPPAYRQSNPQERAALRNALWIAVKEKDSSLAGTALIALEELSDRRARPPGAPQSDPTPAIDRSRVAQAALALAADDTCGELSRITALSICGRMGVKEIVPIAPQLAQTADSIPLRIAAIAALGDVGDPSVLNLLEQLATGSDARLKRAAQAAMERAKKHTGN